LIELVKVACGKPYPLGASLVKGGCNFAVRAPAAEKLFICLYHSEDEAQILCVPMQEKSGGVWHCFIHGIEAGQRYGYRTQGSISPETGQYFDHDKLLIDPYAKSLSRPLHWRFQDYEQDSSNMIPKSVVVDSQPNVTRPTKPNIPLSQTIVYEAHVKGISRIHPQVPDAHKGKFLGACHPAILEHLKQLGITSIQFLPVFAFMPEPYITDKGLTNYWGYNTINFFSPEPRYVVKDGIAEFKYMVDRFHEAGIEVILDVVYNHTAESGMDGPILSFRGLNNPSFYLFESDHHDRVNFTRYINNSGCGNSVNLAHPDVQTLVMDSLRHWVSEMGVDGFRFDLAASLGRDPQAFSTMASLFRTIYQDPLLATTKLIAEPWDIGWGGYQLGQFPPNWQEVNDKYRDTVRAFWRGDTGLTGEFATRLMGSRDIFNSKERSIHASVNHVSYHDGFTLHDLVTYSDKHNRANLEDNHDGHGHNLSCNYGIEGETDDAGINQLREKQKRNLFATLMLSQGIPHMLGGDEMGRTQGGNNNAYCQDNEISWYHWHLAEKNKDFLAFCAHVIAIRRSSKLFTDLSQQQDEYNNTDNVSAIRWYQPDGLKRSIENWHDPQSNAFGLELVGQHEASDEDWLLLFNAFDTDLRFSLPSLHGDFAWQMQIDTRYNRVSQYQQDALRGVFLLCRRSLALFKKVNTVN
jgi:glycogen operon protein